MLITDSNAFCSVFFFFFSFWSGGGGGRVLVFFLLILAKLADSSRLFLKFEDDSVCTVW